MHGLSDTRAWSVAVVERVSISSRLIAPAAPAAPPNPTGAVGVAARQGATSSATGLFSGCSLRVHVNVAPAPGRRDACPCDEPVYPIRAATVKTHDALHQGLHNL